MRQLIIAVAMLALGLDCARAAAAQNQKNSKGQPSQQAKQELDAAKDKLKDANQDLSKAEKDMDKAESAHQSAQAKIQKARQAAIAAQGKKLGLPTATAQHTSAQRGFETAHSALVKEIRASTEHQAATKASAQASAQMQQLRDDPALPAERKQQFTAELAKTLRRPAELERERTEADANLQQLRLKLAETGKQVTAIQAQAAKAAEGDSDMQAAQQAERDAADKLKSARAEVDKHKKEVAAAQKKATTESQQYQKAQSQTKIKPGKNDK